MVDFDRQSFAHFYEKKYDEPAPIADGETERFLQVLENLNFIQGRYLTLVGLLLFGKNPTRFLPEMKIDACWFKGVERSVDKWHDQKTITGTLPEARGFLSKWQSRLQGEGGFNTTGELEVPPIVFKELLTNALVHRDYFIRDSIKLFVFDDRIEIRSPGKLPNSLTVDQMKRGVRRSRNAILASFAPDLLDYREIGSGVLRALKKWPAIDWKNDVSGEELTATIKLKGTFVN